MFSNSLEQDDTHQYWGSRGQHITEVVHSAGREARKLRGEYVISTLKQGMILCPVMRFVIM